MFTKVIGIVKERFALALPAVKKAATSVARAVLAGAAIAGLTVLAAELPDLGAAIDLDPATTGQITALILIARDFLKSKGQ